MVVVVAEVLLLDYTLGWMAINAEDQKRGRRSIDTTPETLFSKLTDQPIQVQSAVTRTQANERLSVSTTSYPYSEASEKR